MPDWMALFSSFDGSGVYTMDPGTRTYQLKRAALARKLDYSQVDLKDAADKKALLGKLSHALDFPDYFGMNWDALSDCLTDMGWRPAPGYVIVVKKFTAFAVKCPAEATTAGDVFAAAAQYWKQKAVPFYIILS